MTTTTTSTQEGLTNADDGALPAKRVRRPSTPYYTTNGGGSSASEDDGDDAHDDKAGRARPSSNNKKAVDAQPAQPGSYRLTHVIKENHSSAIAALDTTTTPTTTPTTTEGADNFVLASTGAEQASAYRARFMDLASHYVNQPSEFAAGGPLHAMCIVRTDASDVLIAVAGDECAVLVLSLAQSRAVAMLRGHAKPIVRLVAHPTRDRVVASLALHDSAIVWDVDKETALCRVPVDVAVGRVLAFARAGDDVDDALVLCSEPRQLGFYAWQQPGAPKLRALAAPSGRDIVDACLFAGPTALCAHQGGALSAFDAQGALSVGLGKAFKAASLCQRGTWAAVGHESDGSTALLSLQGRAFASTGQMLQTARVKAAVTAVAFGPSPDVVFAGTADGVVLKWQKAA